MKKRRILSFIIALTMTITAFGGFAGVAQAAEKVIPSKVDYTLDLNGDGNLFLCNKKGIGTAVGTEYFMTYTVEKAPEKINQTGVIGTNWAGSEYPFVTAGNVGGIYHYVDNREGKQNLLLVEGRTYFMKFTITKDGYKYEVAWAEADSGKSKEIQLPQVIGEANGNFEYFGLFMTGNLKGRLIKIRCYDKKGNDLGVQTTPNKKSLICLERPLTSGLKIEHTYDVVIEDQQKMGISSKFAATSSKVFIEYQVASAKAPLQQVGLMMTNENWAGWPYQNGYMKYDHYEEDQFQNGPLLTPGAKYFIIMEAKNDGLEYTIQRTTADGKITLTTFAKTNGDYDKTLKYRGLWFYCASGKINAVLKNMKIYDSNGNNLGVMTNHTSKITHHGEREDYSGCESMYYCDQNDSLYALYADKTLKFTADGQTQEGNYRIEEYTMTVNLAGAKKDYHYLYSHFDDENENKYRRLNTTKLVFDTGAGSAVETQVLNAENGFTPMRPEDPTLDGNSFEGWYTADGEEFVFDKVVASSQTVYAKWKEVEYQTVQAAKTVSGAPVLYIGGAVLMIALASAVGVVIIVKGKKNGRK